MDPALKAMFEQIGISEKQLKEDRDMANFLYDFIEQHGGVEAVRREQAKAPPLPKKVFLRCCQILSTQLEFICAVYIINTFCTQYILHGAFVTHTPEFLNHTNTTAPGDTLHIHILHGISGGWRMCHISVTHIQHILHRTYVAYIH